MMASLKRWRTGIVWVLIVALLPLALTGCYGRFPLTKKIYAYNGEVSENKWVKSIVMWVFIIVPVYGIGMLADAIVINLVEFWSGKQLMASMTTVDSDGNAVTLAPGATADEAILTVSRDNKVLGEAHFVRVSDQLIEVRDAEGQLRGTVARTGDTTFQLTDAGGVVRTIDVSEMSQLALN